MPTRRYRASRPVNEPGGLVRRSVVIRSTQTASSSRYVLSGASRSASRVQIRIACFHFAAGGQPRVEHRPQDRGGSGGIETGQIDQPLDIRAVDERAVSRIERSGRCAPRVEHCAVQIDEELLNEPRPENFGRDRRRKGADVERVAPDCGIGGRVLERAMGFDPQKVGHAEGPRRLGFERLPTQQQDPSEPRFGIEVPSEHPLGEREPPVDEMEQAASRFLVLAAHRYQARFGAWRGKQPSGSASVVGGEHGSHIPA
jgi:hypothetical protein